MSVDGVCPDCRVQPGEIHEHGCDIERCPLCGLQAVSCDCMPKVHAIRVPWTGTYLGVVECQEYGLYAKLVPGFGWVPCAPDEPGATEDLNKLYAESEWDAAQMRFTRKNNS